MPLTEAPLSRRLYVVARDREMGEAVERIQAIAISVARQALMAGFHGKNAWVMRQIEFGKGQ